MVPRTLLAVLAVVACGCKRVPEHRVHRAPARVLQRSLADVAADVTPSVVNVFSARDVAINLGSGVIISPDGLIVTNVHVVEEADAIAVVLADGRELEATVVGSDPESDVAVIRVGAHHLHPIELGDSSKLRVGDLVLAVGNPFGIGQTVTLGIISATGRANLGINDVEDFIQTDAAINPGNSGGALVDMDGKLVGINTAIMSRTGGYQGIGFAIPSNMIRMVERQLVGHGKVTRGFFGASMKDGLRRSGVIVDGVTPDGPAARAGIASGDVIVAFAGVPVADARHLRNLVTLTGPAHVRVEVMRGGKPLERDVALVEDVSPRGRSRGARPK
jgi:S1-C subfamily serine protease